MSAGSYAFAPVYDSFTRRHSRRRGELRRGHSALLVQVPWVDEGGVTPPVLHASTTSTIVDVALHFLAGVCVNGGACTDSG